MQEQISEVQRHIEHCLRHFMNKEETLFAVESQTMLDIELAVKVWDKMEEMYPDFFQLYWVKRRIAEQIRIYNYLHKTYHEQERATIAPPLLLTAPPAPTKNMQTRNSYQNSLIQNKEKANTKQVDKENVYPNPPSVRITINPQQHAPLPPLQGLTNRRESTRAHHTTPSILRQPTLPTATSIPAINIPAILRQPTLPPATSIPTSSIPATGIPATSIPATMPATMPAIIPAIMPAIIPATSTHQGREEPEREPRRPNLQSLIEAAYALEED